MKVKDCMCSNVYKCTPETSISEVAKLMGENHIGCVPVCDTNNAIVGLVTDRDILLRSVACNKNTNNTKVSDIMTCNINCCTPDTDINEATKTMCDCQIRRIPVVENNKVVGILTLGDLVNNKYISDEEIANTVAGICNCNKYNNAE